MGFNLFVGWLDRSSLLLRCVTFGDLDLGCERAEIYGRYERMIGIVHAVFQKKSAIWALSGMRCQSDIYEILLGFLAIANHPSL